MEFISANLLNKLVLFDYTWIEPHCNSMFGMPSLPLIPSCWMRNIGVELAKCGKMVCNLKQQQRKFLEALCKQELNKIACDYG
jgi:hypothetical protein